MTKVPMELDVEQILREFHATFDVPISERPQFPSNDRRMLRLRLISEEVQELIIADGTDDLPEVADALADLVYVIFGMALEYGIPLNAVLAEVHRANMTKRGHDGSVFRRSDGKILKPPGWQPPDIAKVLGI